MNDYVAGLVERLEKLDDEMGARVALLLAEEAASTIRALVAENERLQGHLEHADYVIGRLNGRAELQAIMSAHNDTLAKLREAVEVIQDAYDYGWDRGNAEDFLANMEKPHEP